ncbi:PEP-utilizing enzyme [Nanoarchaeota archaeon]
MTWEKLLGREGFDIPTLAGIDIVFFDHIQEFTQSKEEKLFTHFTGKYFNHYIAVDSKELGIWVQKKWFSSPERIKKHYEAGKKLLSDVKKKSWKGNLLKCYKDYMKLYKKVNYIYSISSWLAIEAWQKDLTENLRDIVKRNKLEDQHEQITLSVYQPWKKTAVIEIQDKLEKGVPVKQLVKDYQFLRSYNVIWYRPIHDSWVKSVGQSPLKDSKKILSYDKLVKLLKPTKDEKKYLELAPYMVFFKDWRDDVRRLFAYHCAPLFDRIAKHFSIHREDLGYLTLDEIQACLENDKFSYDLVAERKKRPVILTRTDDMRVKVIPGVPAKYEKIMQEVLDREKKSKIKGLPAHHGKVKGIVKLVNNYHDIKKVEDGDILVANTTNANYLSGMKRAAAFVTNEGGVISHAAIVAREMDKPCIVGTKNATEILRDGDLIEVDATKGEVRIISK